MDGLPAPPKNQKLSKVLIVEDNPDNMITLKALLVDRCAVLEAENGQTGLNMAKKHLPDLILLDIALPEMNGIDVLKEFRKDVALKNIPVIAVTANAMKGDKEEFISVGFNGYISKPIDNATFQTMINEFI